MFSPGDTIDRYKIDSLLGEGGMGRVYRAHDARLRRHVALKVLRLDKSDDPNASREAAGRMMREARAAAALDHPNAVAVFDVGEALGTLYIAMELVSGTTLRPYVGDRAVPWEKKLRWLIDTARALEAAHDRGLVHRDVKPENVMVRDDGVVKVLDFGVVKRIAIDLDVAVAISESDASMNVTETASGLILGTPRYLSPEQVRGQAVDGRADQFAWGVLAYELLSGVSPWKGETSGVKLIMSILNDTPEPLSRASPEIPSLVEATIMKTLAKSPADRFASMAYVVSSLEAFVSPSRGSFAEVHPIAMRKTDPAPPMPPPAEVSTEPRAKSAPSLVVRPLPAALFVAVIGVALAAALAMGTSKGPGPAGLATPLPVPPSPSPTAITDLPPPATESADARAAFHAFAQSFRDGTFDAARETLIRAAELDPGFAAAHLRLAFMESQVADHEAEVRRRFKKAVQYRVALSERDQAMLDALEPYLQRDPSDLKECVKRLEQTAARYPFDAEIAYYLGSVRYDLGKLADSVDAFDRAIAIDPKFAQAYASRGGCLAYMGKLPEALASLDQCLSISASATDCIWHRAMIHEQEGACSDMEADARQWISRDSDDPFAYEMLAKALFAQGRPMETVRTALEQRWVRVPAARRPHLEAMDRVRLDLVAGDFASSEKRALAMEREMTSEPGAQAHAEPHMMLSAIYAEEGRLDALRKVAGEFLDRKDAWAAPHRVDDGAIAADAVPMMLAGLFKAGGMTRAKLEALRAQWLTAWREKTSESYVSYLWIHGYAATVETREDARVAKEALAAYAPLPPYTPQTLSSAHVGRVFLLTGDIDRALPELKSAAASCISLFQPITHTHAMLDLGAALEQKHDVDGACGAYRVVLERWGNAKPRSVTRDAASQRSATLGCAKRLAR